jgi:holliday junction DNA helicase RuvB
MDREKLLTELADDNIRSVLEEAVAQHEAHTDEKNWFGFEWHQVRAAPQTLNYMVRLGLVNVSFKSNKTTAYRLPDVREAKALLQDFEKGTMAEPQSTEVPNDLFDPIILHDEKKDLLRRAIRAEKPVHALLVGDVASSKTLFLMEMTRLPNSELLLGSSLSRAGVYDLMFNKRPTYLLIDELDKITDYENISALLSLMETGILSETKYKRRRVQEFKVWVFGSCNYENRIPPEILSRFGAYKLYFRAYTPDEYVQVAQRVLTMREGVKPDVALYIAKKSSQFLNTRDVRVARSIARTASTKDEVDEVIRLLETGRKNVV